jgi:hypothetical protein
MDVMITAYDWYKFSLSNLTNNTKRKKNDFQKKQIFFQSYFYFFVTGSRAVMYSLKNVRNVDLHRFLIFINFDLLFPLPFDCAYSRFDRSR